MKEKFHLLTLVTNKGSAAIKPYLQFIQCCINAGVTCVQLREKLLPYEELFHFGRSIKHLLDLNNVPLIINDDVDLCLKLDAAGVHLGQTDNDATKTRSVLGPNKIIGLSVNTIQQVQNSKQQPINYIGIGAIFPTRNKPDIKTIWGLDGLKQASSMVSHPIVAIGGIDDNNAFSVMAAGAHGIAAIGAFHDAPNPLLTAQNMIRIIKGGR